MSVSSAKRRANRLNAQKSTGPKTAEGKAASSRNAITHGIFCKDLLMQGEDAEALETLKQQVARRFSPRDVVEAEMAEQYLSCVWRLKRLRKTEALIYRDRAAEIKAGYVNHYKMNPNQKPAGFDSYEFTADEVMKRLLGDEKQLLEKLGKYEQRMFNTMLRCMKELRALQAEEIDETCEVQNEATALDEANAQNEATEVLDAPKPSRGEGLQQPSLDQMQPGGAKPAVISTSERSASAVASPRDASLTPKNAA